MLAAAFALQVIDDAVGGSTDLLLALAILAGAGVALLYARTPAVPTILTVLGPAPVVFLGLFLLASPVSRLVLPEGDVNSAKADIGSKAPVVFVVFDEFDGNMLMDAKGRIDPTRYPNLATLAKDATWYRNATTVNSHDPLAVPPRSCPAPVRPAAAADRRGLPEQHLHAAG